MRTRLASEQNGYGEDSDTIIECPRLYDIVFRQATSTFLIASIVLRNTRSCTSYQSSIPQLFQQNAQSQAPQADKYTRNTSGEAKLSILDVEEQNGLVERSLS